MGLPFLNKRRLPQVVNTKVKPDGSYSDGGQIAEEMLKAFEAKDGAALMDCLRAAFEMFSSEGSRS